MIITLKNTTSAEVASRIVELRDERGSAALSRVLTLLICVPDLIDVDNAIEASRRVDDPAKRLIKLALFRQGQMVVIRVDNWFDGRLNTDAGGRLTTIKPDTVRHGWGVKSIQWTARKYGGQAVTDVADHWFTLTVLLPSTNTQEDK